MSDWLSTSIGSASNRIVSRLFSVVRSTPISVELYGAYQTSTFSPMEHLERAITRISESCGLPFLCATWPSPGQAVAEFLGLAMQ